MTAVLMSIRPKYSQAIFAGEKTVELRRRRPSFRPGTQVLVYSSSPCKLLQGTFEVGEILTARPSTLWKLVKDRAGIDRKAFDEYFRGCSEAFAIEIQNARRIEPAALGIRPPQSYLFLRHREPRHQRLLRLADAPIAQPSSVRTTSA